MTNNRPIVIIINMSLQERTLVVKNFDPEKTTNRILKELCLQGGPVRNVVIKPDHAFVEFDDVESVGYSKALLDGIELFGKKLYMEPKTRAPYHSKYTQLIQDYIRYDKQQQALKQQQRQQQMMAACYAQQQLPIMQPQHIPINPNLRLPTIAYNPPPVLNFNGSMPINPFMPQSSHRHHEPQLPSTSMQRSRSFNHNSNHNDRHRGNFSRGRPERASDRGQRPR